MTTGRSDTNAFVLLCALPPEALAARIGLGRFERQRSAAAAAAAQGSEAAAQGSAGAPQGPAGSGRPLGTIRLTGMGPIRARKSASKLASSVPDGLPVVVVGVGGALVEGFEPGDLVVASALGMADACSGDELEVLHRPTPLDEASRELADRLFAALAGRFTSTRSAPLLSAGRTARGAEREILGRSGAVICDTESVWLGRLAERRPFAVVRSIVDTPERELLSLKTVTGGVKGLKRLADASQIIAEVLAG